ncbi:MAG: hypothetical protein NTU47_01085 [Ignavibacteriales bacterium]|nr:hypothetical protein [Ignavibacteriales bacterium]
MKTPLVLRYVIWSMLIFAVSMGLLSFRALRSLELRSTDFTFSRRYYLDADEKTGKDVDAPVMSVPFYEQIPHELFLELAHDVTHRLREAGAKVVIVPLPANIRPTGRNLNSIRRLIRDSIVIFGVSTRPSPYFGFDPTPEDKQYWWVQHPLYHRVEMHWGAMTEYTKDFSRLSRFVPTGIRDETTGEPVPEVIVLALKRFFDIPDNAELPVSPSRLHIGTYAFPIERDGLTYTRFRLPKRRTVEMYASLNPTSDSLMYWPAFANRANDTAAVRSAWKAHEGKIVIIDWNGSGAYRFPTHGLAYSSIVNSFFDRSFVKVHNEWNVLLITTLVILLSVVSYVLRNGFMVFLSLALSVSAAATSAWLFNSHDVLFEPIYIIVPILLCGFVLPIAKLAGERRIAEERAKSLQEENRRLLELQRSTPPGTHF